MQSLNMQRKPGFPVANCSIKMPDSPGYLEPGMQEEEKDQQHRRQQLINFAHSQWGFNNWSWAVTKQELDFVELTNGKYCAGVVAFVSVTVKSFDIHRENIGYATSAANTKGLAIHKSRKCAVTNALRETLLSFGGSVATELLELSEPTPAPAPAPPPAAPDVACENNQNLANKSEPKTVKNITRKDVDAANVRAQVKNVPAANAARACPPPPRPAPAPLPRAPPHHPRPNSNEAPGAAPPAEGPAGAPPPAEGAAPDPDEAARAERRRRQRLAQEEFRLKQLMKNGADERPELSRDASSLDRLLLELPSQDIVIQESADSRPDKRPSPPPGSFAAKRRASHTKLHIVSAD